MTTSYALCLLRKAKSLFKWAGYGKAFVQHRLPSSLTAPDIILLYYRQAIRKLQTSLKACTQAQCETKARQ